jgi:LPS O-antigen subunit length determinant protein (WzzB/FepE family)
MNSTINQSFDLISFLWTKKKPIFILGFIAALTASIISFLIEEKFESSVILYPAKTSSVTFIEFVSEQQSISKFGDDEEAEQMLQILESNSIRGEIISKYNLANHYDIDVNSKYFNSELYLSYKENIHFERNNNGAVIISVMDKSPDTAALIANDIAALFDSTKNNMIHERAIADLNIKKNKLDKMKLEMKELIDTMSILSSLGVVTNEAYQGLTEAFVNSKEKNVKREFKTKMEMSEKYGSTLKSFQIKSEFLSSRIATMKTSYEQAESNANSSLTHKFLVEKAFPADKKAYPIRWLIVIMSTMSTLLLTIIVFLFIEKFNA